MKPMCTPPIVLLIFLLYSEGAPDVALQISTEKQVYATETDVEFLAVFEDAGPLEFYWRFGDSEIVRTTSRTFIKRFLLPDRYNVTVRVSGARGSVTSEVYPVVIQTAVRLNRLLYPQSVLLDTVVTFSCRINSGSDQLYLWNFGDGSLRHGHSTEHHVYNRTGEFTVEVTVFNLVSSASLKGRLFVVSEPCQPPPVKNMGPGTIQVWRYEPVTLGVTFESQIQCNISRGLRYSWTLYTQTGQQLHIPHIHTDRQSLSLPQYLLHYGTYTATAKVEIVGSIVYSNYSVQIEVMSSSPVSVISRGTHVFISRKNNNNHNVDSITLEGHKSYDPDFPDNPVSYKWKCRAVKSAESSCFTKKVLDNSSVLTFPVKVLQPHCDLFKLTLTVHSKNRSASSDVFITILCEECRGNSVNWNKLFSVSAECEHCPETFTYSWKLYLVNASSKIDHEATDASGDFREDYFSPDLYNIPSDYSSAHGELDYELFHSEIEEGDGGKPVGRPTGPYDLAEWTPDLEESRGENLVDPSRVKPVLSEKTLLDLDRDLIQPTLFQSYTLTGTSSSIITFKPTTLRPKTLYMLEVSASFEKVLQGKSQLFFRTHSSPDGTVCQVQPSSGLEIHTHFSVFCTSGKQDLLYDYSFTVGKSSKQRLYEGRDFQHYFYLPAGDPHSNHEVTVYIEIRSRFGSATKPCPVTVTVLPSFQRNSSFNPDQDLFVYGLGNVSSLMLTGNSRDIINYVSLLTTVLNRLSLDPESSAKLQTQIRASLISALCHLTVSSQDLLLDILRTLTDLLKVSTQVTFESANLATKCIHHLSSQGEFSLSVDVVKKVVFVLSKVLEVPVPFSRPGFHLKQSILHIITDSVLMFTQSSRDRELSVNSTFMKLMVWKNYGSAAVKNLNMTTVYIPDLLDTDKEEQTCFITQLISYKHSPYQWARTPTQLNRDVAEIKLFNCTSRVEIRRRHLSTPVIIEFQTHEEVDARAVYTRYEAVEFTLVHFEGNTHLFTITPELLQKSLQLTVQFSRPGQRPFPIMLLFRMHKRPTPTLYITQEVYHWKRERVQIFLPSSSLTDAGMAYLMLLNADYDKVPFNKYTAKEVNYTLSIESLQCLSWDDQNDWTPEGCTVLKSFTSSKINCSSGVSLTSCFLIAATVALYTLLLVFSKLTDIRTERSSGTFLLPDNRPSDQFLYAVTIHTGLRSRATMTAKVYIILYGENGVSQTRELSNSGHKLFTSNSTNTFILSSAVSLGQVWEVYLWHDGSGSSPSWFVGGVLVEDLLQGCGWRFQAQCWLAVDEGDGRVERRLSALEEKLTFRERLYLKLSDYVKDFHPWLSIYTCPSFSAHTHTQRMSVCFLLLQAYMCANTWLIYLQEEQYFSELGVIGVSLDAVITGLCAVTLLPVGTLVSCLFRISKLKKKSSNFGDQYKVRLPFIYPEEASETNMSLSRASSLKQNRVRYEQGVQDWKNTHDTECVTCNKLTDNSKLQSCTDSSSRIEVIEEDTPENTENLQNQRIKNSRFSSTQNLLWIQSVFFSLIICVFAVHPALILISVICVTLRRGERGYFYNSSSFNEVISELLRYNQRQEHHLPSFSPHQPETRVHFQKVLEARQRERRLRLARPPTSAQLKCVRSRIKRRTILSFSGFSSRPQLCGKLWCYKGTGIHIHLGKNRSETSSKLQNLSRNTKAMLLQFTVYNPPYNLFITVTVLREWSQTGAFQPLIFIHSSRLYSSDTALHHCLTAAELLFLLFTLLQFYFHMCVIPQSGWSYWRNRWNWIEVITLLLSLLSFFFTVHHFTLRTDVVEQLQRGDFKAFVDITPVSSWEQTSRSLHGILVFLLLMKCLHVLRLNEVMTAAVSTTSLIFSGLLWPLIFFVILVMAVSCLGNLLFRSDTSAFSTFLRSVYWVTSQCLSVGKLRFLCRADLKTQTLLALTFYGALLFIVSVVLKAAVTGALCSYIKTAAKSKSRKPLISICDLLSYTRDMALGFIDRHRKDWIDNYSNTNNLYLEEFEELVDELLLRLSVMSNSDCHKEQENYVNQRNLSSARDNSLEAAELEEVMIPVELEHSFVWSVSSHTYEEHDENNLRSPQEWKSLEDFEGNREILTDRPTSKRQKIQNKIQRKTKGTLHCGTQTIKVQMEYSDTLNSNRTKQEDYSLDKPVRRSQTQLNTGLNSSPGNLTSYSSHIEAYEHFCTCKPTVEKRQPHSEEQRVNIPGQCC
ncbi:polycystin-1-like protein 1 [Hoplias malabaricus]|uniref:polycystin-1-like protein 1 n=1 Tax=Hoplias malabaricus TaxID=27720 RepID=UPI0034621FEF